MARAIQPIAALSFTGMRSSSTRAIESSAIAFSMDSETPCRGSGMVMATLSLLDGPDGEFLEHAFGCLVDAFDARRELAILMNTRPGDATPDPPVRRALDDVDDHRALFVNRRRRRRGKTRRNR